VLAARTGRAIAVDLALRDQCVVAREQQRGPHQFVSLATGLGAVTGAGAYGYVYGRHALEVTRATIPVAGLPPPLAGLRIGLMTDVHRSIWVSGEDVSQAVIALMNEQPDLVVLGGDYVTWGDRHFVGPSADALRPLSAPHGVFGILGNHDDDHDMPTALARNGVQMLKDARTRIVVRHEAIDLVGIRFWTKRQVDIAQAMMAPSDAKAVRSTRRWTRWAICWLCMSPQPMSRIEPRWRNWQPPCKK